MAKSYQIKDPEGLYFLTFQVAGRAEVSIRQVYRDIILESLATIPEIFGYIGMIDKKGAVANYARCRLFMLSSEKLIFGRNLGLKQIVVK